MWVLLVVILLIVIIGIYGYIERDYLIKKWKMMNTKPLEKGDHVFISDLILSPQYNNLTGTIASDLDKKKKRFAVKIMYQEKYITVKPENLSKPNSQNEIESILRNIAIDEKSKYFCYNSVDFIELLLTKYNSNSLPPLNKLFNSSFKNYSENSESVYCVLIYLSLFCNINKSLFIDFNKYIDRYDATNKLRLFTQDIDLDIRNDDKLSILFLEFFNHKICLIKYNSQFRVIHSLSNICKYSLFQELQERNWLNIKDMENFCDLIVDILFCKQLNRSLLLFGSEMDEKYFNDNVLLCDKFKVIIMNDVLLNQFIKCGNKMLKYIVRSIMDKHNKITIKYS